MNENLMSPTAHMGQTPTRRALGHLDANRGLISPINNFHSPAKKVGGASVLSPVRQQLYASGMARTPALKRKLDYVFVESPHTNDKRQRYDGQPMRTTDHENIQYRVEDDLESSQESHDHSLNHSSIFDSTTNDSQNTTMTEVEPDTLDYMHEGYLPQHNQFLQHAPPYISHHSSPQRIADKAEELRLRLRLLMYKIRTNQIHVPLGDLAIISHNASPSRPSVTNELRSFAQSAMLQSHDGTRSQIDVPSPIPYDGNMEINAAAQALSPYTSSPMSRKLTS